MSHIAATVATLARSARQAANTLGPRPWIHAMSPYAPMDSVQIPLSQRTSSELRARAMQLWRMASTATTADTRASLEALANRFTALAERREADEAGTSSAHQQAGNAAQQRDTNPPD